jgi:transposase
MPVKYKVSLTPSERDYLTTTLKDSKVANHKRQHAQILLSVDENGPKLGEEVVAEVCGVSTKTVSRARKRFVEEGLEIAVESKFSRHGRKRKLDGEQQAQLIALTCSDCPEGRSSWTLELLAEKLIQLKVIDNISSTTVGRELKKMN